MTIYYTTIQGFDTTSRPHIIPEVFDAENDIHFTTNELGAMKKHIEIAEQFSDTKTYYVSEVMHSLTGGFPLRTIIKHECPDGQRSTILVETYKKKIS